MSLYVTDENGKRWFKLEGQGCLAFPEDAWVQVLEHRIKQKDAMIDWLAEHCVYMASMAFPFSNETEEEMKKQFLKEAEQAAREGRKWGEMPKSTEVIMLTENEWKKMPPGSDAAIANGCTCPRMDNGHGEGFLWNGKQSWWIAADCPLHGAGGDVKDAE